MRFNLSCFFGRAPANKIQNLKRNTWRGRALAASLGPTHCVTVGPRAFRDDPSQRLYVQFNPESALEVAMNCLISKGVSAAIDFQCGFWV